ncbi:putative NAD(P)-binding protein [Mucilaginibacter gracilis]|uniref:Putative NAD(P)-binding protein n=1 Tax=Mucilaginibacter gracilis TaxID=423350 RepID=A0A495J2K2_9SPHI|nr:NAD(P)H-binding protein [Mucilaginibacter gracilis]RKR82891.1 putative NAD(P)-binding protein [Mucilaginibacter gracilis]
MKKLLLLFITLMSLFSSDSNAQNKPINTQKNMKKVLVIGASGSLAKYVIDTVRNLPGVQLTLLARNRKNITNDTTNCTVVEADVMDYAKLKNAVSGQDIVYINLAGDLEAMAKNIVKAMQETGVKRVIAISSIGIYITPLKPVLVPYRKLADVIESSGLDYTILRPEWFTSANEVDYVLTHKGEPETGSAISRKSIAAFVAKLVKDPDLYKNENLGISKPQ